MGKTKRVVTPFVKHYQDELKVMNKTAKMDKELQSYGNKVQGGYMWTAGDLAKYFLDKGVLKKRR